MKFRRTVVTAFYLTNFISNRWKKRKMEDYCIPYTTFTISPLLNVMTYILSSAKVTHMSFFDVFKKMQLFSCFLMKINGCIPTENFHVSDLPFPCIPEHAIWAKLVLVTVV